MNCPYCNEAMEKGSISYMSPYCDMFWVVEGKSLANCKKSEKVMIAKRKGMFERNSISDVSVNLNGFYCCNCRKIIADVNIKE